MPCEPATGEARYPAKSAPFTVIHAGNMPFTSKEVGLAARPVTLGVMLPIWIWLLFSPPPPRVPLVDAKLTVAAAFCCTSVPMLIRDEEPAFCRVLWVKVLAPEARFTLLKVALESTEPAEFCDTVAPFSVRGEVDKTRTGFSAEAGFRPP